MPIKTPRGKYFTSMPVFFAIASLILLGCSQDEPAIVVLDGTDRDATHFFMTYQTASTEEMVTTSMFRFEDERHTTLQITLQFKKSVPPGFVGGSFKMNNGKETYAGAVIQKNFRYLGGQGDGISVGGDFLFATGHLHYQFHLPLTKLDTFSY